MPQLLWDACALAKRYFAETGSDTVDAIFDAIPSSFHLSTVMNYAETAAILRRKRNNSELDEADFVEARLQLLDEVLRGSLVTLLPLSNDAIIDGVVLSDQHNINSTDAAILAVFLKYVASVASTALHCILITSDHRLLRAASAEGLQTFNPEAYSPDDVPAFFAQNV